MDWRILLMTIATVAAYDANDIYLEKEYPMTRNIPEGLKLGAAICSYQSEGAWESDGKSENIWDHLFHTQPCFTPDCTNGDVASDSYNKIERDVQIMRELDLDFYRISLSWTRILPTSFPDIINKPGVEYYNKLIDEMLRYNIEPVVTLYHWDLPQKLQELGGWVNPNIVDWFGDFARVCFQLFGDRVKNWITINEPHVMCIYGYDQDVLAPALNATGFGGYLCGKNVLVAHARAWHIYDEEFRLSQNGSIGITLSASWAEPEKEEYREATEQYLDFDWGWFADPIFSKEGGYPSAMTERIAAVSAKQGYFRSRLPEFTDDEKIYVKGSSDFFGLNHYYTFLVYRNESLSSMFASPSYDDDSNAVAYTPAEWTPIPGESIAIVPRGLYKLLARIREKYDNPRILINENGFETSDRGLNDSNRAIYIKKYLNAILDAIEEGSEIIGYAVWSIMDNFHWTKGYTTQYGLYQVDFNSTQRTRTPRLSAFIYKQILRSRIIDRNYQPNANAAMTIQEGHQKRFNFKYLKLCRT